MNRLRTCTVLAVLLPFALASASTGARDASTGARDASMGAQGESTPARGDGMVLRVGKAYTLDREARVIAPCTLVIRGGRIVALGRDVDAPGDLPKHDLPSFVALPGLIDAETDLASDDRDTRRSVATDVRALDGWDFFDERSKLLAGGVTTVYLGAGAPDGSARLVSGRGAVVKTAGSRRDPLARIVRGAYGLTVTLGVRSRSQPVVYDPPLGANPDNPFVVLERPLPQSRAGELLVLRELLERGRTYHDALVATSASAARPRPDLLLAPLASLLRQEDVLWVRADKARDIYHALELARANGIRIVLEGAAEAELLAAWIAALEVPVVVRGAFRPGRLETGDLASPALEGRLDDDAIARLVAAGVRVVLTSPTDAEVPVLLEQAAAAVRYGLDPTSALRAVTTHAALALGIEDRVGSLEVGKDADIVLLDGDPLERGARPRDVLIAGELVRRAAGEIPAGRVVVRCGRLFTGDGERRRAALVIVNDGKIERIGDDGILDLPPETRVVDASAGTVIPGLIDSGSVIGLRAESSVAPLEGALGESGASPAATLRVAESIDPADPSLRELLAAGITTVVVTPPAADGVSGQASVLKLASEEAKDALIRPYAALCFGGVSRREIEPARKYHEAWSEFDKKRAEALARGEKPPDPPEMNRELEPWRALFTREVPALVEARDRGDLERAFEGLGKDSDVIVAGLDRVPISMLDELRERISRGARGVLVDPPFVIEERGRSFCRPQELAARGASIVVRSRVGAGARRLPLELAHAVAAGLDPDHALAAMSSHPAALFGVAERVGRIAPGLDADLVILDDEPFALATRVLEVWVEGRRVLSTLDPASDPGAGDNEKEAIP